MRVRRADHEATARRVLKIAEDAMRVYLARFGPLPMKSISIVDAPLVSTMGSAEFAGLSAIASAFYIDFDSSTMRNMPEPIREQRASVEDSLEWTVAHVVAHQWWGAAVGNDPGRENLLGSAHSAILADLGQHRGQAADPRVQRVAILLRCYRSSIIRHHLRQPRAVLLPDMTHNPSPGLLAQLSINPARRHLSRLRRLDLHGRHHGRASRALRGTGRC